MQPLKIYFNLCDNWYTGKLPVLCGGQLAFLPVYCAYYPQRIPEKSVINRFNLCNPIFYTIYKHGLMNVHSKKEWILTVLWGLILAILRANSMASTDGLQRTGVLGNSTPGSGREKCPTISNIFWVSLLFSVGEKGWLRVSKHIIPSKQSSNPSLFSAFLACSLSPLVKICHIIWRKMDVNYLCNFKITKITLIQI